MRILLLLILLAVCGCQNRAERTEQISDFNVDKLFTHEGCTVYRFKDGMTSVYYSNCTGSTQRSVSCGKNCHRRQEVETNVEN